MPKKQKESNNYIVGARVMALDLGAFSEHELQDWAYHNPKIWGNGNGSNMFCSELAFIHPEKRPDGANKLSDIIDHWTEVRDRLSK